MNRNLLTQIKNEWRDNIWLVVELAVVSAAIWALLPSLYNNISTKLSEKGFDTDDVYRISVKRVSVESPEYVDAGEAQTESDMSDLRALMRLIRKSPYVESAAFSSNALPYQFNYAGNSIQVADKGDSVYYSGNLRMGSPEIATVIRPVSSEGLTVEKIESILREGNIFISEGPDYIYSGVSDIRQLVGGRVTLFDTIQERQIGGVIKSIRRNEYEKPIGTILFPIDESVNSQLAYCNEIAVRVKPGMGKKFEEQFYSSPEMRRHRNIYLSELSDMRKVRKGNQADTDSEMRMLSAGIVFLLIIIFLGLVGTFWFRIKQRAGEIALRKTCGATSADIFRRTIGEGLILLAVASVAAMGIDICMDHFLLHPDNSILEKEIWLPALSYFLFTAFLTAMMIIAGIAFPALRAMKIEPAITLKDQ